MENSYIKLTVLTSNQQVLYLETGQGLKIWASGVHKASSFPNGLVSLSHLD